MKAFHFVTVLMNTYLVTILGMLADHLVEFTGDVFTGRQTHTDRQTDGRCENKNSL